MQLGDDIEPLVSVLGVRPQRVVQKVGVGPLPRAADPAPQLVELRQAHPVGIDHHDGVRIGDIETRLDDRGADQHVRFALDELDHDIGECGLRHLAMADHDAGLRHQSLDALLGLFDRLDSVVDVKHLAAALQFALDDLFDQVVVVGGDEGLDRQRLLRRSLDHGEIAYARQRHVQRARDRRGGQRQYIHRRPQLLELLLLHDAEALLLVEDDEPEILEPNVLLQQAVGPDHHIDLAHLQSPQDVGRLRVRTKARQHVYLHRERLKALAKGQEVLLREDGGGYEDRHLLAVHHRLERAAHRQLRLAKAPVSADQPVHRARVLHVDFDLLHDADLVGRLVVGERLLELLLPGAVLGKGVALDKLAPRIEVQERARDLLDRLADFALGPIPLARAQSLQLGRRVAATDVLLHAVEVLDRHVQLVALGVLELHVFAPLTVLPPQAHADEPSDAVIDMDDQVAGLELQLKARGTCPHHAAANPLAQPAEEHTSPLDLERLRGHQISLHDRLGATQHQHSAHRSD